jgi:long-chain acyl-CoA synthetase
LTDSKEQRAQALESLSTLCEFFQNRVRLAPDDEALREFDKSVKKWISYSYRDVSDAVLAWRRSFARLGLARGTRVAMLLPNGVNAVCFDQAALANALVPVPLHAIDTPGSSAYILQDSGSEVLVTNKLARWLAIQQSGFDVSAVKKVILTDEAQVPAEDPLVERLSDWLAAGSRQTALPEPPKADDLAAIVYTSGTTGKPKGVMLTHANIASNVRSTLAHVKPDIGAVFLSFLPLSHTFERTAGYYLALATGSTIVFNRSLQLLGEDFKVVRPHVMISVPRVYERIYAKLNTALAKKGKMAQLFFESAVDAGWEDFCRRNSVKADAAGVGFGRRLLGKALKEKVSRTLQEQFGGRLKVAISGGAALNTKVAKVFCGLGLPIIQGYGMTETSPIIAGNTVEDNDPDTVGRLLRDVEVRLGEAGEVQVRAASVMKGYWGRPKETQQTFTEDGWLKTGDVGCFDANGRLRLNGRIKEIIVTSTGEKISPVDIETAAECDPLISQAYAVGDGEAYIAVLVSLEKEAWAKLAKSLGLTPEDPASLQDSRARQAVLGVVRKSCAAFPAYAVPRNVALTLDAWTIENGLLTPTLKLKRGPMKIRYQQLLKEMYQGLRH